MKHYKNVVMFLLTRAPFFMTLPIFIFYYLLHLPIAVLYAIWVGLADVFISSYEEIQELREPYWEHVRRHGWWKSYHQANPDE